jgi:hypothetical protein
LKSVELFGSWRPMCFNCAGVMYQLSPMPRSIVELKEAVSRERRDRDRRFGKPDTRVFVYERRVGERRTPRAEGSVAVPVVDDDMIIEVEIDMELALAQQAEEQDITQIRELVQALRPSGLRI